MMNMIEKLNTEKTMKTNLKLIKYFTEFNAEIMKILLE
jgi:hypothetical protein